MRTLFIKNQRRPIKISIPAIIDENPSSPPTNKNINPIIKIRLANKLCFFNFLLVWCYINNLTLENLFYIIL